MHVKSGLFLSSLRYTARLHEKFNLHQFKAPFMWFGYPRQPSPRVTLAEVTFNLFLSKLQPTVYIKSANSSRGARQLGWASCLTLAGRVTLASRTTFLDINALARLPGTVLGVASVTQCLNFGFIAEICIKEVKINLAKHTLMG